MSLTGMAPDDPCATASRAAPGKVCVAAPNGVVLSPNPADAARLAGLARDGEARMLRHFGRTPARYAIVQDIGTNDAKALNKAGFKSVLPWLTPAQMEEGVVGSLRRGAEAQARAQGVTGADAKEAVDAVVARWRAANSGDARVQQEAGIVPHEAGHLWYMRAYWPNARADGVGHYGGPGPDWMDETAAVLMEADSFAADRRAQFKSVYTGAATGAVMGTLSAAELVDLPRFLGRDHPGKALQQRVAAGPVSGGSGVRILAGPEAVSAAGGAIMFYLQSRLFADYLIERTGKPAIFGAIGAAFGRGLTIERWLAASGRANGLPGDVAELDADWRAWLVKRYGPVVIKPAPAAAPTAS